MIYAMAHLLHRAMLFLLFSGLTRSVCVDVDLALVGRPRTVFSNQAAIRMTGLFPYDMNTSQLRLSFSPPLLREVDFTLDHVDMLRLPPPYQRESNASFFHLLLVPGRSWLPRRKSHSYRRKNKASLVLTRSQYCGEKGRPLERESPSVAIAHVRYSSEHNCPKDLSNLPRVRPEFQVYLNDILSHCQRPSVLTLSQLQVKRISSLQLLYLHPPVFIVDARAFNLSRAGMIIDSFLASHSVLEIVWEPLDELEPKWWVMMPRPIGLPGHIFAMIDILQWQHPSVRDTVQKYKANFNCSKENAGCTPGCPNTKVVVTWCSGWGADTNHMAEELLRSLVDNEPLQIGPVRYPFRKSFPAWNDKIGWSYTFGACNSNFLDCFFMDHSPCPPIIADVWNDPGLININQSSPRFKSRKPENENFESRPSWWKRVEGSVQPRQDLRGDVVRHTLYTYFIRPKYELRRKVQIAVDRFSMEQDSCVFLHVRRGDILLHGVHSR